MCLITGCVQSTQIPWLPLLANIAPQALCQPVGKTIIVRAIAKFFQQLKMKKILFIKRKNGIHSVQRV